ncbi:MAG: GntR family transcriptional regulator [Planctomycetaceae bacterium]|nr:GntR family transcriptional regulator [Planctomycetaceae bacterium]
MEFVVDTGSREPIYRQLAIQIREGVARGRLTPGDKLPSVRELSQRLIVNPNTIARAYTELEREGVLHTRQGMGVFIARPASELTKTARRKRLAELADALLTEAVYLAFDREELLQLVSERAGAFQWNQDATSRTRTTARSEP